MRKALLSSALVLSLAACGHKKPVELPVAAAPAPKVVKVNGEEVPQSDIDAIASELSLPADSSDAVDMAIYVKLLKAYAAKNEIVAPEGTETISDTMGALENGVFEKAAPPPPGSEPYLKIDHAYLYLDKVKVAADKKKAKPSAEAFRKAAAADGAKPFMAIFEEQKLRGAYWHVADDVYYPASAFPWVPADLPLGETSKLNATAEAYEIVRVKERFEAKYEDRRSWLKDFLTSSATIEK